MTPHNNRHTEVNPHFPKPKYGFTQHLTDVGDFVETHEMSWKEALKINKAAHFWAWRRKYRVHCWFIRVKKDVYRVRVTLMSKQRFRDYG